MQATLGLAGLLHRLCRELIAEGLHGNGSRRPALNAGMGQPAFQNRLDAAALDRVFAAGIKGFTAASKMPHQGVEKNIAWAGVKSKNLPRPRVGRQKDDTGQSAEMDQDTGLTLIAKEEMIDQRRQARASAASCQVAGAEIAENCHARAFRDNGGHAETERGRITAVWFMPGMMSAKARTMDLLKTATGLIDELTAGCGKRFAKQAMGQADLPHRHRLAGVEFEQKLTQIARIVLVQSMPQTQAHVEAHAFGFQQCGIDAVAGGAGSQTDQETAGGVHGGFKVLNDSLALVLTGLRNCFILCEVKELSRVAPLFQGATMGKRSSQVTANKQNRPPTNGLQKASKPPEALDGHGEPKKLRRPDELSEAEMQRIIARGFEFMEKAAENASHLSTREIQKLVDQAVRKVRSRHAERRD